MDRPGDGVPAGGFGNEELVLVVVRKSGLPRHAVIHCHLDLLVEAVGEPFQKKDREDVVLVVSRVDLATQNVGGPPKPGLQFHPGERHRSFSYFGSGLRFRSCVRSLLSGSRGPRHAAAGRLQPPQCTPPPTLPRAGLSCRDRAVTARGPRPRRGFLADKRLERGGHRDSFGELRPSVNRREEIPEPVAHAGFRLFGADHQHGHACHRPGNTRRHEGDCGPTRRAPSPTRRMDATNDAPYERHAQRRSPAGRPGPAIRHHARRRSQ